VGRPGNKKRTGEEPESRGNAKHSGDTEVKKRGQSAGRKSRRKPVERTATTGTEGGGEM